MTHPRTLIRKALVERLIDATSAEDRVYSGRLMPIEEPYLPAIVVHTREPEEITSRSASGWNGFERRRCIVTVVCVAQSYDDIDEDLDAMAGEVETALQSFTIPGFESAELNLADTRSDDPEFDGSLTTGATRLRYECIYMTPYRDGPNPYVIDGDEPIERSGAYPGGRITPDGQSGAACPVGNATIYANEEEL
jgi:hypothetical protein